MLLYNNEYINNLKNSINRFPYWNNLDGNTVLITGATGLVCSYMVDMIMLYNELKGGDIQVLITGRDEKKAIERFEKWFFAGKLKFIKQDMSEPLNIMQRADYVVHGAGNAYPFLFDKNPVGTMKTTLYGTDNLLEYAVRSSVKNFVYISSGEVYGEREMESGVDESFCGYTDYMQSRSCYPVSKMAAETLCASYSKQYSLHTNIARLCHVYGPTMTKADNRVINQFLRNVLEDQDIIMKSSGSKVRSYCYVADAVIGLLYILIKGESSIAYNVAFEDSVVSIKEIAQILTDISGKNLIISSNEETGCTNIEKSILDNKRLKSLGWNGEYNMNKGLKEAYLILKGNYNEKENK